MVEFESEENRVSGDARIACDFCGSKFSGDKNYDVTVTWYRTGKDGVNLGIGTIISGDTNTEEDRIKLETNSDCRFTLVLSDLTAKDEGNYWCFFKFTSNQKNQEETAEFKSKQEILKVTGECRKV